jgi:opacity protein-like surface antigen
MDASPLSYRARRALALAAALAAALGFTGPAAADLYLGFGSGRAALGDRILGASDEFNGEDTSEHYFLGFRLGRHASFEFGRADLGLMTDTITVGGVPTPTTVATDGHTLSLLFTEPVADDLALFLRVGVFDWDRESAGPASAGNHSGDNGTFGLGASLRVSDHLVLRAEYQRYEVGHSNVDVPMLAVLYRF